MQPGRFIALVLMLALISACATPPSGRAWGEDATLSPGWRQLRVAAWNAARSPRVWAPLAVAALLQVDGWDRGIADWAREETPLFGSTGNAARWSDDLRTASIVAYHATALAAPGGGSLREWVPNKLRGYAVGAAAIVSTTGLTSGMKAAAGRERPNGADDESFPSGHTAVAAVHDRLAALNLRAMGLEPRTRRLWSAGLDAITIGTSWARIEAGWHFPSDTLVSASMGAFFAQFYDEAFLGAGDDQGPSVGVALARDGAMVRLHWQF
jgi:membrane-associated phospholipid phosphatase